MAQTRVTIHPRVAANDSEINKTVPIEAMVVPVSLVYLLFCVELDRGWVLNTEDRPEVLANIYLMMLSMLDMVL